MKTKELKEILKNNRNVKITIDNQWVMTRNIDSMSGECIYIENINNVDKWYCFDSNEYDKAIKFFMTKISYCKSFRKIKKNFSSDMEIKIVTN